MPRRRSVLIVALLLVVLLGASYAGVLPRLEILGINDKAVYYPDSTMKFEYRGWFEQFGEVLDSARYTAAIDASGTSEKILVTYQGCKRGSSDWSIQPALDGTEHASDVIKAVFYVNDVQSHELYLPVSTFTESSATFDCNAGNWYTVPFATVLTGKETGELRVEMWQRMVAVFLTQYDARWVKVAEDRAALVSGAGSCEVSNVQTKDGYEIPFAPGASVEVDCRLGYASSAKSGSGSWKLYGDWQGAPVLDFGAGPYIGGIKKSFAAPMAAGLHDLTLVNSLWPVYTTHFTITVNPERAPPPPKVTTDPAGPWLTGMTIAVSWESPVSPVSKSPIKTTFFKIEYIDAQLIKEGSTAGEKGGISFNTGGRDVDIRVVIWSQDEAGEFSAPTQPVIAVAGCDLYVSCKEGDEFEGSAGFPLWVIFVLLGIAAVLLSLFIPFISLWPWKVIIVVVGGVFILIAVLLFPG